jgi:transcriptional regulator with XRE-family HTH domain
VISEKAIEKRLEKRREEIAVRVTECLKLRGLRQEEFANMTGIKVSFVNRVMKAKANLTLQTMSKLELALDLELIRVSDSSVRISSVEGKSGKGKFNVAEE